MRREASAHTTVAWLAYIRFIEEWVVGVDAVNNEKYGNINSGVILQVFYYTQDNTTADGKKIRLLEPFEIYMNIWRVTSKERIIYRYLSKGDERCGKRNLFA